MVELFDGLVTVRGAHHLESFRFNDAAESVEDRAIIVDEEDSGFVHGGGKAGPCRN